jgi:hypothetical protein
VLDTKTYEYETVSRKVTSNLGRGALYGCEMLRISHYLNNRVTDGGKVVSLSSRTLPSTDIYI